jgi:hypothetical protein
MDARVAAAVEVSTCDSPEASGGVFHNTSASATSVAKPSMAAGLTDVGEKGESTGNDTKLLVESTLPVF